MQAGLKLTFQITFRHFDLFWKVNVYIAKVCTHDYWFEISPSNSTHCAFQLLQLVLLLDDPKSNKHSTLVVLRALWQCLNCHGCCRNISFSSLCHIIQFFQIFGKIIPSTISKTVDRLWRSKILTKLGL